MSNDINSFSIVGGLVWLDKKVFVKEMLKPDSMIKPLLKPAQGCGTPQINRTEDGKVSINWTPETAVAWNDNYEEYFQQLKDYYGSKIGGVISIKLSCIGGGLIQVDINNPKVEQRY